MAGSVVGYFETFVQIGKSAAEEWEFRGPRSSFLQDFVEDVSLYGSISSTDVLIILFVGFGFTTLRFVLTTTIFKPIAQRLQFIKKDVKKFPESAFKFICYFAAHVYCVYVLLFSGKYEFFYDLASHWNGSPQLADLLFLMACSVGLLAGWHKGMQVPDDIYLLYVLQAGFYFHSLYATFFIDEWRRDSVVMVLHHVLANLLLIFSLSSRYYNIGMLVLLLHDPCDVFLEFTKICVCLKHCGGKYHRIPDVLSTVAFLLFATTWFVCRLYIYPKKVLYSTGHVARSIIPDGPFYFFLNSMLWALFLMNIWWFHFIIWLIIRVVRGDSREVEDVREMPDAKGIADGHIHKPDGSLPSNGLHDREEKEASGNNLTNSKENNCHPKNMRHRKL